MSDTISVQKECQLVDEEIGNVDEGRDGDGV
jgi:hypothetical protein